jgi:hypothetical protein
MGIPDELIEDPAPEGERVRGRLARRMLAATVAFGLVAGGVGTAAFTVSSATGDTEPTSAVVNGPRKVSEAEAYRLSVMRVQNFRLRGAHITATLPGAGGTIRVSGDVDYRRKIGFAKVTGAGAASGVYQWTPTKVLTWTAQGRALTRPAKLPTRPAALRALAPSKYPLDALLVQLLQLGSTKRDAGAGRGAAFLHTAMLPRIGGVDVIQGPRRADGTVRTYYVDSRAVMHRVTTQVAGRPGPIVDLDARTFRAFPRAAELRPVKKQA